MATTTFYVTVPAIVAAIVICFFDRNHSITEVIRLSSNHDEAFSSTPMLVFLSIPG